MRAGDVPKLDRAGAWTFRVWFERVHPHATFRRDDGHAAYRVADRQPAAVACRALQPARLVLRTAADAQGAARGQDAVNADRARGLARPAGADVARGSFAGSARCFAPFDTHVKRLHSPERTAH